MPELDEQLSEIAQTKLNQLADVDESRKKDFFAVPENVETLLEALRAEVDKLPDQDVQTKEGRDALRSQAMKITRTKTFIEDQGKELAAEYKEIPKLIDAGRKKFRDELDAMRDEHRQPLTDWENAEKERVANHEANLAAVKSKFSDVPSNGIPDQTAEQITKRINDLMVIEQELADDWEEYDQQAVEFLTQGFAVLNAALARRKEHEAEQARLEKERKEAEAKAQLEREKIIAEQAAEKAKAEAEAKAEQEKRELEEKVRAEEKEKAERAAAKKAMSRVSVPPQQPKAEQPKGSRTVPFSQFMDLDRPLVWFDLETTGVDTEKDRIIQMGVVCMYPNGERSEFVQLFNPGCPIPADATAVHGITDADVQGQPTFQEFAPKLETPFRRADWAGYNILGFDVPLLLAEFRRAGIEIDPRDRRLVDLFKIFQDRVPHTLEGALAFYAGKQISDAHDAMGDVLATIDVGFGMLDMYPDISNIDELTAAATDPKAIDLAGKFTKDDQGQPVFNFGGNKGQSVYKNKKYLDWMIRSDFPAETKEWAIRFKKGKPRS